MRLWLGIRGAACLWLAPLPAWAEGLVANLEVRTPTATERTSSRTPPTRSPARPTLLVSPGQTLTVQWEVRDTGPEPIADVLTHCFVVAIPTPAPGSTAPRPVVETALTMDFNATNVASGTLSFHLPSTGLYSVEVVAQGNASRASTPSRAALEVRTR